MVGEPSLTSVLQLRDVSKRYGDRLVLDGLGFTARPGRTTGFLGANGSGKTTTMRAIFGLVTPESGTITWHGDPIDVPTRRRFGYMPEQRGLYPRMAIADQLSYFGRLHGLSSTDATAASQRLLDELGLGERAQDRLEVLSHGNQQRIQLAAALVHDPDLLVLDEPFSGLDPLGVAAMTALLQQRTEAGATVLFSSHQLDLVQDLCDDVVLIDEGRVVLAGDLGEVRLRSGVRVAEIAFATEVADPRWFAALPEAVPLTHDHVDPRRVTLRVPVDTDVEHLAAAASTAGTLESFAFRPPTLTEIFLQAVRR